MLPPTTDVLVVGAGPAGLAVAATLAQRGVRPTVVDRQAEGANTSRAAVVHARTLEVLEQIGVSGQLAAAGIRARQFTIRDRDRILVPVRFDRLPTRYPYALMVSQAVTEAALLDRLTAYGGRVLRPYTVAGLELDGTAAAVATFTGGERIRARYLVGADGMHSMVRDLAGIGFAGITGSAGRAGAGIAAGGAGRATAAGGAGGSIVDGGESFTLADILVDGALPSEEVVLFFSRAGVLVAAPLPGGTIRIVAQVDQAPERPGVAYVQALLDARGPRRAGVRVREVLWGSRFRIHHRVADTFRAGPVLLAGDAAHVHSPAGGQGMNLGLQDAVALGTALADVLAGAPEERLDQYAASRRPIAVEVVTFAHRLTRLATAPAPLRPVRNLVLGLLARAPAFRRRLAWQLSGLVYRPGPPPKS